MGKRRLHQYKDWVNHGNLKICVQILTFLDIFNNSMNERSIKLATFNASPVKSKDSYILDIIVNGKIQLAVVTETWLKDLDEI